MNLLRHGILISLTAMLLTGCLTGPVTQSVRVDDATERREAQRQLEFALKRAIEREQRLYRISYPILVSAYTLCQDDEHFWGPSDSTWGFGFRVANQYAFNKDFQPAAMALFNLDDRIKIIQLVPDSPAGRAGLQLGDSITRINHRKIPSGKYATAKFYKVLEASTADLVSNEQIAFEVIRNGESLQIAVTPEKRCNYPVLLSNEDVVNAYANGSQVVITKGMMRFVESDEELALVIAHEVSHNALSHVGKSMINSIPGLIIDVLLAKEGVDTQGEFTNMSGRFYSKEFEAEADYVGLYLLAQSGYEFRNTAQFWRRLGAEDPGSIYAQFGATHPSSAYRFSAMEKTIAEIEDKIARNVPLTPAMKAK